MTHSDAALLPSTYHAQHWGATYPRVDAEYRAVTRVVQIEVHDVSLDEANAIYREIVARWGGVSGQGEINMDGAA